MSKCECECEDNGIGLWAFLATVVICHTILTLAGIGLFS